MEVKTIAVAILGGAFDQNELRDNDIVCAPGALEELQEKYVAGYDDVYLDLIERSHFELVTTERDALQLRLTSTDEHNDRLIAAINKVRSTVCLPASIEAVLISALDRKEKN